jgi:hypothetical protein
MHSIYYRGMIDRRILPDPATEYGQAVRRRLRGELVIWLTTAAPSGTPQPNPVGSCGRRTRARRPTRIRGY